MLTGHGIPTHRLLERLDRQVGITICHAREGKVGVQAIQRLTHVAKLPWVALDNLVRQAIEGGGKAKPLLAISRRAVTIDVLLHVLGTS